MASGELNRIINRMKDPEGLDVAHIEQLQMSYSNLYRQAAKRFNRVVELIDQGRHTEAKMEVDQSPNLIVLVEELHFKGLRSWIELCRKNKIDLHEYINNNTISQIKEIYFKSTNIEPLIAQYRKLVLVGTNIEKIDTLREIIKKSPDDKSWAESLRPLEEERLKDLVLQFKDCNRESFDDVEYFYNELFNKSWVSEVPEKLKSKISENYLSLLNKKVSAEAAAIAEKIPLEDLKNNRRVISQYLNMFDQLKTTAECTIPEELQSKVDSIRQKMQKLKKQEATKEEFLASVQELESALAVPEPNSLKLKSLLKKLQSYGLDIPNNLTEKTRAKLEVFEKTEAQKNNKLKIAIIAVSAIIIVFIIIGVVSFRKSNNTSNFISQVNSLLNSKNFSEAQELYDRKTGAESYLLENTEVIKLKGKIEEATKANQAEKQQLAKVITEMNDIAEAKFVKAPEIMDDLVGKAEKLAVDPKDKIFIEKWKLQRSVAERKSSEEFKNQYTDILKEATEILASREDMVNAPLQSSIIKLNQIIVKIAEVDKYKDLVNELAVTQMTDTAASLNELLTTLKDKLVTQGKSREAFFKTVKDLQNGRLQLSHYVTAVDKMKSDLPEDLFYAKVSTHLKSVQHAISISKFEKDNLESVEVQQDRYNRPEFITHPFKSVINKRAEMLQKLEAMKTSLEEYFSSPLFSELYEVNTVERKTGQANQDRKFIVYDDKKLQKANKPYKVNGKVTFLWQIEHIVSEDGDISTEKYNFYSNSAPITLMQHIPYAKKLKDSTKFSKDDTILENLFTHLDKMVNDPKVNAFVKVFFITKFLNEAVTYDLFLGEKFEPYLEQLSRLFAHSVIWAASTNENTIDKEREVEIALNKDLIKEFSALKPFIAEHQERVKSYQKLLDISFSYAGVTTIENEKWAFRSATDKNELLSPVWSIKDNELITVVIAKRADDGLFYATEEGKKIAYVGMPFIVLR